MRLPVPIFSSALIAAACCASGCESAAPRNDIASAAEAGPSARADEFEVVALRYANASELASVLRGSLSSPTMRVLADARTNSLVLAGPPSELGAARLLIAKLDIPAK